MTAKQLLPDELVRSALAWAAADPDPTLRALLRDAAAGLDRAALTAAMGAPLKFGTAGLRGVVGPGPSRMNRAVVRRTAYGLARWLARNTRDIDARPVVVGHDARPDSGAYAAEVVSVLSAARIPVRFFERPVPTPLVAFAQLYYGAVAGVVITASHNPPAYNGLKLFAENGVQIIPPQDGEVEALIAGGPSADAIPVALGGAHGNSPAPQPIGREVAERYWSDVVTALSRPPRPARQLKIVSTALHGVGGESLRSILCLAGFHDVIAVAEQEQPDGRFPTVAFPNPELPSALTRALAVAKEQRADLLVAVDPDADRLAVAVPNAVGRWIVLTGNQVGCLLADFILARTPRKPTPLVLSTVVSTPMIRAIAESHGARAEETLTGFKWLWNAALAIEQREAVRFTFAFEEAIGYSVTRFVRDKDGISAALAVAEMAAQCHDRGQSLNERLVALYRRHGLWVSQPSSIATSGDSCLEALDALATDAPLTLGERRVVQMVDYRRNAEQRPAWRGAAEVLAFHLEGGGRAVVRPSGTEPKLKVYVDLTAPLPNQGSVGERERMLSSEAAQIASQLVERVH